METAPAAPSKPTPVADNAPAKPKRKYRATDARITPQRLLIESLPAKASIDDAMAAAKRASIPLTRKQASKMRYDVRKGGKVGGGRAPESVVVKQPAARATTKKQPKATSPRDSKLLLFKQLILELGMDATQEIWDEFAYVRDARRTP